MKNLFSIEKISGFRIFLGTIIASLLGLLISAPTIPVALFSGIIYLTIDYLIFGWLPMLLISGLVHFLTKNKLLASNPERIVWTPALLYLPVFLGLGILYGNAFQGKPGEELKAMEIFFIGFYGFWIIPLISLIFSLAIIHRKK